MDGLEDFLKGDEPAEVTEAVETVEAVETTTEEAQPETAERPRGPDGKFIPKGDKPETEQSVSPTPENVEFEPKATLGERRRRQEAEAERDALLLELRQLRTQGQPQQQAQQPQEQGPPDRWEDPDGYDRWLVNQAATAARAEAMQTFQYQRIETSATEARSRLPDYDDKIGVFGQMVQVNPALLDQLHRAPNPAEYAYNTAKMHLEISQFGGIEGLIKARVDEALKAQAPAPAQHSIPETLADAQSARGSSAGGLVIPSLDEIVRRR